MTTAITSKTCSSICFEWGELGELCVQKNIATTFATAKITSNDPNQSPVWDVGKNAGHDASHVFFFVRALPIRNKQRLLGRAAAAKSALLESMACQRIGAGKAKEETHHNKSAQTRDHSLLKPFALRLKIAPALAEPSSGASRQEQVRCRNLPTQSALFHETLPVVTKPAPNKQYTRICQIANPCQPFHDGCCLRQSSNNCFATSLTK